jgi:hypothetical protein
MDFEKSIFIYAMVITIGVYALLAINFLSLQGIIISKNAQLTQRNALILENMLDRSQAMANGTIKTAGFNLSMENNQILHQIHEILDNMNKTR